MARTPKILVAEDDAVLQKLVKRALEGAGYGVEQAFNGLDLLKALTVATPDLIVLDAGLPDSDGRDLLGILKRDHKTRGIPVLVWSGRDPKSERVIAIKLGAQDFVAKGSVMALLPQIQRILSWKD